MSVIRGTKSTPNRRARLAAKRDIVIEAARAFVESMGGGTPEDEEQAVRMLEIAVIDLRRAERCR
jgi:hypothetical protein